MNSNLPLYTRRLSSWIHQCLSIVSAHLFIYICGKYFLKKKKKNLKDLTKCVCICIPRATPQHQMPGALVSTTAPTTSTTTLLFLFFSVYKRNFILFKKMARIVLFFRWKIDVPRNKNATGQHLDVPLNPKWTKTKENRVEAPMVSYFKMAVSSIFILLCDVKLSWWRLTIQKGLHYVSTTKEKQQIACPTSIINKRTTEIFFRSLLCSWQIKDDVPHPPAYVHCESPPHSYPYDHRSNKKDERNKRRIIKTHIIGNAEHVPR